MYTYVCACFSECKNNSHVSHRTQFLQLMELARMSSIIRILRNALTKNREAETAGTGAFVRLAPFRSQNSQRIQKE